MINAQAALASDNGVTPACCITTANPSPVIAPTKVLNIERFHAGTGNQRRKPWGLRRAFVTLASNLLLSPLAAIWALAMAPTPLTADTPVAARAVVPPKPEMLALKGIVQSSTGPLDSVTSNS
jgi:hypothetical protein